MADALQDRKEKVEQMSEERHVRQAKKSLGWSSTDFFPAEYTVPSRANFSDYSVKKLQSRLSKA